MATLILYLQFIAGDIETLREYLTIFPEVVDMREPVHGNVGIHIASSKGNIPLLSLFLSKGMNDKFLHFISPYFN